MFEFPPLPAWLDQAACVGHDPELFYPNRHHPARITQAQAICHTCPVINECADYAATTGDQWAILAGTLPEDRAGDA